ncbi:ras association domain-containing protein 5 isoform X1 [Chiloscyllium plagiosum]|uniref:ras association domain-containing protein 5 isoform X1 n=1 Tax=Chiloscyllium plagiosum TaxID=36176 RepID=UPI001CB7B44C|nr:ras association domain-containing protein 5 isoform X1 [Chiloscyllium plagiosum]
MPIASAAQSAAAPPLGSAHFAQQQPEDLTPRRQRPGLSRRLSGDMRSGELILRCVLLGGNCSEMPAHSATPGLVKMAKAGGGVGGGAGAGGGGMAQGRRVRVKQGAHRPRDVRTIFHQTEDPRVPEEKGEGHCFVRCSVYTWCDYCGQQIPLCNEAARCKNCNYTVHQECRSFIKLDCQRGKQLSAEKISPANTMVQSESENVATKEEEEKPKVLSAKEIKQKIEEYNGKAKSCLGMRLNQDGTYTGFIKVHLKLRRPVTVPAGIRPQSIYDVLKEVNPAEITDKRTSFYLPLDAIKQLHISSVTTVNEVITSLLKKFMVIDNPQKFALFYQTKKDNDVHLQKLKENEHPLLIRLLAGPDTNTSSFALKENETGEVEWDAFSVPELQNFLMILEKEEKERIQQVQQKYTTFRQKLEQTLKTVGKPG